MEFVKINDVEVPVLTYKGQRVVTFAMIDKLHGRPEGTASRNFRKHRRQFIEGKHYFEVGSDEIRRNLPEGAFSEFTPRVVLMTEAGYLKLVKPFQDDLSWQVQDLLIECYFRVKSGELQAPVKPMTGQDRNEFVTEILKNGERMRRTVGREPAREWVCAMLGIAKPVYQPPEPPAPPPPPPLGSLRDFFEKRLVNRPGRIPVWIVKTMYQEWCESYGYRPLRPAAFDREAEALGWVIVPNNGSDNRPHYDNLRLRQSEE